MGDRRIVATSRRVNQPTAGCVPATESYSALVRSRGRASAPRQGIERVVHVRGGQVVAMNTVPTDVAYLVACALGLAFRPSHEQDSIPVLVEAAQGDPGRLRQARAAVADTPVGDDATRRRAAELLLAAAATLERRLPARHG